MTKPVPPVPAGQPEPQGPRQRAQRSPRHHQGPSRRREEQHPRTGRARQHDAEHEQPPVGVRGRCRCILAVVPANAGTHNHRRRFCERRLPHALSIDHPPVLWVPAFAGTTADVCARTISDSNFKQPSPAEVIQIRRMGGAKRYPSIVMDAALMGFASLYPSYKKTRFRILAARSARSYALAMPSKTKRAQGKPGALSTRSRAHKMHTGDHRCAGTPGLPCAMVLRLIARSPWRRIPLASVADELTIRRHPVGFDKSPSA